MEHAFAVLTSDLSVEEMERRQRYAEMLRRAGLVEAVQTTDFSSEEPAGTETFRLSDSAKWAQYSAYFSIRTPLSQFKKVVPFAAAARITRARERSEFDAIEIWWHPGGAAMAIGIKKKPERSCHVLAAWAIGNGAFPSPEQLDEFLYTQTKRWRRHVGIMMLFMVACVVGFGCAMIYSRELVLVLCPILFMGTMFPAMVLADKPGRKR